jgi:hypothetical protein
LFPGRFSRFLRTACRDPAAVIRIQVLALGEHLRQRQRISRHHRLRPGSRRDQDQPPAPARAAQRELLGQLAAPGEAEDVGGLVAELVEQPAQQPGQGGEPVGPGGQRGAAHAGDVEADHLDRRVERIDERLEDLQAGADTIGQQQRRPVPVEGRIATRSGVPDTTTVRMPGRASRGMRSAAEDMAAPRRRRGAEHGRRGLRRVG